MINYPSLDTISVSSSGPILEVTICRPKQANALRPDEHACLHEIWQLFAQSDEHRVAIITGEGDRFFSAGNDLAFALENDDFPMPATGLAGLCAWFDREKPIIAAVNGIAAGGGFEIALACDLIVADAQATFSLPEAEVGTYAGAGGLIRLPAMIGEKVTMEMILTGNAMSPDRAYQLGLVNAVAEHGTVMTKARALANAILHSSPQSVAISKRIVNQSRNVVGLEEAQKISDHWGEYLVTTDEFKEGIGAFLEKRKPSWIDE